MTIKNCLIHCALFSTIALLSFDSAYAYIDPATGALLLQSLIALILGAIVFCRNTIANIFRVFLPKRKKQNNGTESTDDSHTTETS